jgi:hypothetical protein
MNRETRKKVKDMMVISGTFPASPDAPVAFHFKTFAILALFAVKGLFHE